MRFVFRVLYDAILRAFRKMTVGPFASHIALSILTSLFPFLIFRDRARGRWLDKPR